MSNTKILAESLFSGTSLLAVLMLVLLVGGGTFRMMTSYRKSLMETLRVLEEWSNNQDVELPKSVRFLEDDKIHQRMVALVQSGTKNRLEAQQAKEELKSSHAISVMASQVAHDIRSPLAALDSILGKLAQIPEDDRIIIRSAVNRIKDIANNLIEKNRELKKKTNLSTPLATNEPSAVQLLSSLVEPLITEKRMQFRSKIGIEIDGKIDSASYGLFANIQPTEFKRVLSNLVNNSVEAMDDRGTVTISLVAKDKQIEVSIKDNGKGIPAEILNKLGARGETHGKKGGSGLGIFHARTSVESWGGSLEIQSEIGNGTAIKIRLPQMTPPEWFVSELRLLPSTSVVILDDDTSIHQIWQGRFDSLQIDNSRIKVHHFSTPDEITMWVQENSDSAQSAMYLADYELIGHQQSGLDVIEKLGIGPKSILVTSRFEEKHILEGCKRLKVRLIPKGMAGFVPIKIEIPLEQPDCVLIDDDELVNRSISINTPSAVDKTVARVRYDLCLIDDDTLLIHPIWASVAKTKGLRIQLFSSPQEFLSTVDAIDRLTPMYIDVSLGPGISGIEFAHEVFKLGFTEINLATGYEPESIEAPPFIRRIVGKNFPD